MYNLFKSSGVSFTESAKNWKVFGSLFCCHARIDPLLNPRASSSYATFTNNDLDGDENEPLCSRSGDVDVNKNQPQNSVCQSLEDDEKLFMVKSLTISEKDCGSSSKQVQICLNDNKDTTLINVVPEKENYKEILIDVAENKTETNLIDVSENCSLFEDEDVSSSGISSLTSTQPNSMEFDNKSTVKHDDSLLSISQTRVEEIEKTRNNSESIYKRESVKATNDSVGMDHINQLLKKAFMQISTEEQLLSVINTCKQPGEILANLDRYIGPVTPFLAITCIHQIYLNALNMHTRNSPAYNKLCGEVLTHQRFRSMVNLIQENASKLGNFALLTAASDLLYLRLTLKQSTIPTLLSFVEYEAMDLDELRLLASCLHTPNIPMINCEYMYNISASVACKYIDQIEDLYTLLNIMKCFGRYFNNSVKRQCEQQVVSLSHEFTGLYPDGRSMSAHMLDAFFRMEHAPLKPLLQQASDAIVHGSIPIQPQDISAILRYFVKFGYTLSNHDLLYKLSSTLHSYLPEDHASQFTTNVKWLTVFYHFNKDLLATFVSIVNRDLHDLDFVALSDVLDALAQVYYMPDNADWFFERLHDEMLRKLPTLTTSHVHNAKRKLLLTAFHFAVFGRYPQQLIQLTLNDRQIGRQSPSRYFMKDLCRAVSIERPDLLPRNLPRDLFTETSPLKLYAFEKDVEHHLSSVVGSQFFGVQISPVRNMPVFILRMKLDGELLKVPRSPSLVPPHMHQTVHNIAIVPLPRSRFCIGSKHAVGKSRFVLRLLRAQGARIVLVPHYEWDQHESHIKIALLKKKIFEQRADDQVE